MPPSRPSRRQRVASIHARAMGNGHACARWGWWRLGWAWRSVAALVGGWLQIQRRGAKKRPASGWQTSRAPSASRALHARHPAAPFGVQRADEVSRRARNGARDGVLERAGPGPPPCQRVLAGAAGGEHVTPPPGRPFRHRARPAATGGAVPLRGDGRWFRGGCRRPVRRSPQPG